MSRGITPCHPIIAGKNQARTAIRMVVVPHAESRNNRFLSIGGCTVVEKIDLASNGLKKDKRIGLLRPYLENNDFIIFNNPLIAPESPSHHLFHPTSFPIHELSHCLTYSQLQLHCSLAVRSHLLPVQSGIVFQLSLSRFLTTLPSSTFNDFNCFYPKRPSTQRLQFYSTRSQKSLRCLRPRSRSSDLCIRKEVCWIVFNITEYLHKGPDVYDVKNLPRFSKPIHNQDMACEEDVTGELLNPFRIRNRNERPTRMSKMMFEPHVASLLRRRISAFHGKDAVLLLPLSWVVCAISW